MRVLMVVLGFMISIPALATSRSIGMCYWYGDSIKYYEDEILFCLENGSDIKDIQSVLTHFGSTITYGIDDGGYARITISTQTDYTDVLDSLNNHTHIRYAEPNSVLESLSTTPNDEDFDVQWALHNTGASPYYGTSDSDIDAPQGWDFETENDDVLLAILDSGVPYNYITEELTHPDLDDTDRYIIGLDATGSPPVMTDYRGHGTFVTGIAAAETDNSDDIAGILWDGEVLIVKVICYLLGDPSTFRAGMVYAINYADSVNKKLVVNGSVGQSSYSLTLLETVQEADDAGVLQVYGAGNDSTEGVVYPARFATTTYRTDPPNLLEWDANETAMAVAATTVDDDRAAYSSYDQNKSYVTIAAPGGENIPYEGIYSLYPDYSNPPYQDKGYWFGTSFAAPMVSALATLAWERFPTLDATEIRELLETCAEDVNSNGFDKELGHGRINMYYTLAPPAAPTGLSVSGTQGNHPQLSWNANSEPDIDAYNIYKKEGTSNWFYGGTVDGTTTSWTDQSVTIGGRLDPPVYYKIKAEDFSEQESAFSNMVFTRMEGTSKGIPNQDQLEINVPTTFELSDAYPNPFNPSTTIAYGIPKTTDVELVIYDLLGREVWSHVEIAKQAGYYSTQWNGDDSQGMVVRSGVYLVSLTTPEFRAVEKVVLIR